MIALPRILKIGPGSSQELVTILATLKLSKPLIVTDNFLAQSGAVDALLVQLSAAGIAARVYAGVAGEPTSAMIVDANRFLLEGDHDSVIGFGGGSPIDSAKAIAVLAVHGGNMRDYKTPHVQNEPGLPIIAIPTTAGTGSEATRFTIITDDVTDEKMLCAGLAYLPVAAIVDADLTLSMPPRLTADTGIDALTHAIEAYVSKRANEFSDRFALWALELLATNLRRVWREPGDRDARDAMMRGSTYAGIAFSNASVALVHGMSRPIGANFHVPHGLSNAMLLPSVTRFSASACPERYAICARAMGVATDADSEALAVEKLIDELAALNREFSVPSLKEFGVEERKWTELIPAMVVQAFESGSPNNNPVVPTAVEMETLYRSLW
jgi:alcohol dehydrogenase class IV